MNDYERIARVIRYLNEHHTLQPGLDELAEIAGLSQYHFHRLFSAWAGVTPKDFLQCLTLEHAKALLHEGQSVLSAALEAGLSGPGRLHDLCVALEAVSPGELKSGGSGLTIHFGFAATPFGDCLVGETERGTCHLAFVGDDRPDVALEDLRDKWPEARLTQSDRTAAGLASRIFGRADGNSERPTLRALIKGTTFQVRVWRALLRVPPGCLVTYGQIAAAIGQPSAARSVGSAVGHNTLAYLIPCHRVIRETGVIGDYRWGRVRKHAMVAWEASRRMARVASAEPVAAASDLENQSPRRPMKRFLANRRSVSLGILLVVLLWGMTAVAPGVELDSVIVSAIDLEAGDLLLVKLGIAKYTIPLKVGPSTPVVDSFGKPLALSDIRVGAQGTIRYTRSPAGDYTGESLVLK